MNKTAYPFWLVAILAILAISSPHAAGQGEVIELPASISLYVGEVRVLPIRPVSKVALGNPRLLNSTILPNNQLLLMADAPGDTTVHIWLKDGREARLAVHVAENDAGRILRDVRSLVSPVAGVSAREVGGQVFLEGDVDAKGKARLSAIAKAFPKVVDLTQELDMTMKKMVHLDVRIMEFKKSALDKIGINWAQKVAGPTFGARIGRFQQLPGPRQFLNLGTDITSFIDLMVTSGDAIELASPRLSTRSGGEATFLAGGQIPIPTTNTTGQSNVTFKDYGIKLNFKPVTDPDNNVMIKVDTEISMIDNTTTVLDIPGFLTRRTSAEINLRNGEPMALSGLIDTSVSSNVNKFPLLGDIPVLGALFRSTEFRSNRTELVVFVEPRIVDATRIDQASAETAARVERHRDLLLENQLAE